MYRWCGKQRRYLCSSNEEFEMSKKPFRTCFRRTVQIFVAQIEYSLPWKVLPRETHTSHVGNNISETYPRRIGQGLYDKPCILGSMLSSLIGLPNPAWVSLGNIVSHMGCIRDEGTRTPLPTELWLNNRTHLHRQCTSSANGVACADDEWRWPEKQEDLD